MFQCDKLQAFILFLFRKNTNEYQKWFPDDVSCWNIVFLLLPLSRFQVALEAWTYVFHGHNILCSNLINYAFLKWQGICSSTLWYSVLTVYQGVEDFHIRVGGVAGPIILTLVCNRSWRQGTSLAARDQKLRQAIVFENRLRGLKSYGLRKHLAFSSSSHTSIAKNHDLQREREQRMRQGHEEREKSPKIWDWLETFRWELWNFIVSTL